MGTLARREKVFNHLTIKAWKVMVDRAGKYANATVENGKETNTNIRACEGVGVASARAGVLIRLLDKISRLANLEPGKVYSDESVEDTIIDGINYLNIFFDLWLEDQGKGPDDYIKP